MNSAIPTELFALFASTSWRAAWLILVLILLRRLVRGRIPAQVWFAAWLVVALRLLLPFSIPVAWSPYNYTAPRPVRVAISSPVAPIVSAPVAAPLTEAAAARLEIVPVAPVVTSALPLSQPVATSKLEPRAWLALTWLAGVTLIAVLRLAAAGWFRRQLARATSLDDGRVAAVVAEELRRHGRRRSIAILETEAVDAPALYGIVRPRLLFPPRFAQQLNDEELRLVVRHELAHWRRRDLLAQALMQGAVTVHWFNPLAWLAARLARTDCELACDEFVLRRETRDGVSAYGATLLKVLGVVRGRRRPGTVVAIIEGRQQLAQRVRMIADYRGSTAARLACGVALVAAVAATSLTRESHAASANPVPAPAATAAPPSSLAAVPAYTLRPGDHLKIEVFQHPDLAREVVIPDTGVVQLPLANDVVLGGRTTAEAAEAIRARYAAERLGSSQIPDARVNVQVLEYAARTPAAGRIEFPPLPPSQAKLSEITPTSQPLSDVRADTRADGADATVATRQLKAAVEAQQRKVDQLARDLQNFKEKNRLAGFDQRRDLINENLKAANAELMRTQQAFNEVDVQLQQLTPARGRRDAMLALPFIASQPMITALQQQLATRKIELAALSQKYAERHPSIMQTTVTIEQTEKQLDEALRQAGWLLESAHSAAATHYKEARNRYEQYTQDSLDFDRLAFLYNEKARELQVQTQILQNVMARQMELAMAPAPGTTAPAPTVEATPAGGFSVSVMGAVQRQGAITFAKEDNPMVLDAIARAGGFSPLANRDGVRLLRMNHDGAREVIGLTEEMLMAPSGPAATLHRGDIIVVAEASPPTEPKRVSIFGQVAHPGQYELPPQGKMTLIDLLARAGGGSRLANLKMVVLKRTDSGGVTKVFSINAEAVIKGDEADQWTLQPGDIVTVTEKIL